jgi:hypothetical protein
LRNIPLAPFKGGILCGKYLFVKHLRHRSVLLLIYSVRKVHKSGSVGFGLTALSSSLLRRRFLFCGMAARFARKMCSSYELVGWLSGILYVLISPDGNEILFLFCCLREPLAAKKNKIVVDSGTKSFYGIKTCASNLF